MLDVSFEYFLYGLNNFRELIDFIDKLSPCLRNVLPRWL
jgi:hypothetical protein